MLFFRLGNILDTRVNRLGLFKVPVHEKLSPFNPTVPPNQVRKKIRSGEN